MAGSRLRDFRLGIVLQRFDGDIDLGAQLGQPVDDGREILRGVFFLEDFVLRHQLGEDFDEFQLFGVKLFHILSFCPWDHPSNPVPL